MTDLEALLSGVSQAFPDNEPERLVLADYYEEQGNNADAEACRNPPTLEIMNGRSYGSNGYGYGYGYGGGYSEGDGYGNGNGAGNGDGW